MLVWFYGAHFYFIVYSIHIIFNIRVGVAIFIYNVRGFRCSLLVILPVYKQFILLFDITNWPLLSY